MEKLIKRMNRFRRLHNYCQQVLSEKSCLDIRDMLKLNDCKSVGELSLVIRSVATPTLINVNNFRKLRKEFIRFMYRHIFIDEKDLPLNILKFFILVESVNHNLVLSLSKYRNILQLTNSTMTSILSCDYDKSNKLIDCLFLNVSETITKKDSPILTHYYSNALRYCSNVNKVVANIDVFNTITYDGVISLYQTPLLPNSICYFNHYFSITKFREWKYTSSRHQLMRNEYNELNSETTPYEYCNGKTLEVLAWSHLQIYKQTNTVLPLCLLSGLRGDVMSNVFGYVDGQYYGKYITRSTDFIMKQYTI